MRIPLTLVALSCAISTLPCGSAVDPDRDFSGVWVLNEARSNPGSVPSPGQTLRVEHNDAALKWDGVAISTLAGKDSRNKCGEESWSSKVKWEGAALLVNTLVSGPRNYAITDRWKLSRSRRVLTIFRQLVDRHGELEGSFVYERDAAAAPAPLK